MEKNTIKNQGFLNETFKNYNIKDMIIGSIIGKSLGMLSISFVNDLILPILNQDFNRDGKKDFTQLEDLEINVGKYNFKIGKFIVTWIKVIVSIVFALWFLKFL